LCCNAETVSEALTGPAGIATAVPAEPNTPRDKAVAVTQMTVVFFIVEEPFISVLG
jgi:hypothetical protein